MSPAISEVGPQPREELESYMSVLDSALTGLNCAIIDVGSDSQTGRAVREQVCEKFFPISNNEYPCRYIIFSIHGNDYVVISQKDGNEDDKNRNSKEYTTPFISQRIHSLLPDVKFWDTGVLDVMKESVGMVGSKNSFPGLAYGDSASKRGVISSKLCFTLGSRSKQWGFTRPKLRA